MKMYRVTLFVKMTSGTMEQVGFGHTVEEAISGALHDHSIMAAHDAWKDGTLHSATAGINRYMTPTELFAWADSMDIEANIESKELVE